MRRSKSLMIALLASTAVAEPVLAAPAPQSQPPAVQQRETREQPDRWGGQDPARSSGSSHQSRDDEEEAPEESKGSDQAKEATPFPKHPGELNGKLDLGGWS